MTNAISMGVTAFIPLIAFPYLGIMTASKVSATYINNTSFIFIGGFVLAIAMERWNLQYVFFLRVNFK
jgi:sodium-dependent dicarboxylate transporter 2/3/5